MLQTRNAAECVSCTALRAGIWPTPRGGSRGVTLLTDGDVAYALADVRGADLLPPALRIAPAPTLRHTPAQRGASCDDTCAAAGAACDATQFWCG